MKKSYLLASLIACILLLDQWVKIYIKTHFHYNEDIPLFGQSDWARLHFIENEGMAFGITFDWPYGKLFLSTLRVLMVGGLLWMLRALLQKSAPLGVLVCLSMITAGAIGNILDSAYFGLIFSTSEYGSDAPAVFTPWGEGYARDLVLKGFMQGRVVDMFYFPMTYIHFPAWLPVWGGEKVLFFEHIFNIADAAITLGIAGILLFQRRFFGYLQNNSAE